MTDYPPKAYVYGMIEKFEKLNSLTAAFTAGAITGVIEAASCKMTSVLINAGQNTQMGNIVTDVSAIFAPVAAAGVIGYNWNQMAPESRAAVIGIMASMIPAYQTMGAYEAVARFVLS